jgi:hypothetical protein
MLAGPECQYLQVTMLAGSSTSCQSTCSLADGDTITRARQATLAACFQSNTPNILQGPTSQPGLLLLSDSLVRQPAHRPVT